MAGKEETISQLLTSLIDLPQFQLKDNTELVKDLIKITDSDYANGVDVDIVGELPPGAPIGTGSDITNRFKVYTMALGLSRTSTDKYNYATTLIKPVCFRVHLRLIVVLMIYLGLNQS